MTAKAEGTLLIIGGAEDKDGRCLILRKFVELAGGADASVVVITAATERPDQVGRQYRDIFSRLGVGSINVVSVNNREEAVNFSRYRVIDEASGIFFTGGDQLRITGLLRGTGLDEAFHQAYKRGAVIAGTNAGASAMSITSDCSGPKSRSAGLRLG